VTNADRFAIDPPVTKIPWAPSGNPMIRQSHEVTFSSIWTIAGLGAHSPPNRFSPCARNSPRAAV